MKKIITTVFLFIFITTSFIGVNALEEEMRSVDAIVSEIRTDLGIAVEENINVSYVDKVLLEELGDSVMEAYIGNSSMHEQMDSYYGGDDSELLTNLHIQIGSDYLNGYPITMMTFMQYGNSADQSNYYGPMMHNYQNDGYNSNRNFGMMGRNYNNTNDNFGYSTPANNWYGSYGMMNFGSGGMIMGMFGFILVIVLIVYLISPNTRNQVTSNNALNIAKERYARGEITRDEFLQITSTLR